MIFEKGYAGHKILGYELFDREKIGMTTFQQRLNFKRALEGELTKTINLFHSIKTSRVHIVLPEKKLFENSNNGSASVVLTMERGKKISKEQAETISRLVAGSVEGIDINAIAIMDSEGNTLIGKTEDEKGTMGDQYDIERRKKLEYERDVKNLVETIVGKNNAIVTVDPILNWDKTEETTIETNPDNIVPVSEEQLSQTTRNKDTTNNINEEQIKENILTNYEIPKTTRHFISSVGGVKRISVSVSVNYKKSNVSKNNTSPTVEFKPRSQNELDAIKRQVEAAVGFNAARGDRVEVDQFYFDRTNQEEELASYENAEKEEMISNLINKGIIALSIMFAFFVIRKLIKNSETVFRIAAGEKIPELEGDEDVGAALGSGEAIGLLEGESEIDESMMLPEPVPEKEVSADIFIKKLSPQARAKLKAKEKMTEEITKFAKENPDQAATILRSLISKK